LNTQDPPRLTDALFTTDAMRAILSDRSRIQRMLDFEAALARAEVAVGVIPAEGRQYRRFAVNEAMHWPDGVSYSPDGFMYASAAQLAQAAVFNDGKGLNKAPYYIFRFKPLAPGRIGH
jgi:hypothetical protein